ncbi:hypothetical protein [Nocardia sp. NPDC051981]|uniref:hypothetical protein n=1 Tax=Nocardia sp. NPDC051981 TaxID=3155417 RepID=UPI00343F4A02
MSSADRGGRDRRLPEQVGGAVQQLPPSHVHRQCGEHRQLHLAAGQDRAGIGGFEPVGRLVERVDVHREWLRGNHSRGDSPSSTAEAAVTAPRERGREQATSRARDPQ